MPETTPSLFDLPGPKRPKHDRPNPVFLELWCRLWSEYHGGAKYPWTRGRDVDAANRVWAASGEDPARAERMVLAYLVSANPIYLPGHALSKLASAGVLPDFVAAASKAETQARKVTKAGQVKLEPETRFRMLPSAELEKWLRLAAEQYPQYAHNNGVMFGAAVRLWAAQQ